MESVAEFGPYSLVRPLARSSSSVSFLARFAPAPEGERLVALKFIRAHISQEHGFLDEAAREGVAAVRLNHVNVAHTFDLVRWDDRMYSVTEYVDGVPLATVIDRMRAARRIAPPDVAAFLLAEVCAALGYAHTRRDERGHPAPVIHGDVRPRNVLVSFGGEVKVVDFATSRAELTIGGERALRQEDRLHFAAPELVATGETNASTDVFAAAALAYLLLTGRPLYDNLAGAELFSAARRGSWQSPRSVEASIPEELEAILLNALAPNPSDRLESATELRNQASSWLRRTSPGFGRHRLKSFLQKELGELFTPASADASWRPLARREFVAVDGDSMIAPAPPDQAWSAPKTAAAGQYVLREEAATLDAPFTSAPSNTAAAATGKVTLPGGRPGPQPNKRTPTQTRPNVAARPVVESTDDDELLEAAPPPVTGEATVSANRDAKSRAERYLPSILTDPELDARVAEQPGPADEPAVAPGAAPLNPADFATMTYNDAVDPEVTRTAVREQKLADGQGRSWGGIGLATLLVAAGIGGGMWGAWTWYQGQMTRSGAVVREPSVFVTSRPQGATIVIDGVPSSLTTPAPVLGLRAGQEVSVAVTLPGYDTPLPQLVRVDARQQAQVLLPLEPSEHAIRIDSEPPGAQVFSDGEPVGATPLEYGPVRVDYRDGADFVLRLDGFVDERVAIDWEAGAPSSQARVTLRPDPNWVAPPPTTP